MYEIWSAYLFYVLESSNTLGATQEQLSQIRKHLTTDTVYKKDQTHQILSFLNSELHLFKHKKIVKLLGLL